MATAAKRARKKANKAKGWPEPEEQARQIVSDLLDNPVATESEHAAALTALAKLKRMRNRQAGE